MLTMAAILASIIHVVNAGTLVDSSVPRLSEHATLEGCDTMVLVSIIFEMCAEIVLKSNLINHLLR
jgi:hypothetical protein